MKRTVRTLLISLGLLFTVLGVIGVVTPVLPTTPFLLVAGGLFANASPRLHRWLHRNKITGPFLRAYTEGAGLSRRRKISTITVLWVTLAVSGWFVRTHWWLLAILGVVGIAVTVHVATMQPRSGSSAEQT